MVGDTGITGSGGLSDNKYYRPFFQARGSLIERSIREYRLTARIVGPAVVPIYQDTRNIVVVHTKSEGYAITKLIPLSRDN